LTNALVDRYAPLIWSICRRHGLGNDDSEDVGQNVWLKPGWLAAMARDALLWRRD
jgi:hypothetical protein